MSWDEELFAYLDDLEGQAAALYAADRAPELVDRSREEYRSVTLAARLMAGVDDVVTLDVVGIGAVPGRLARVASDWCLLRGPGQDWVVRLAAVAAVQGGSDRAVPEVAWPAAARLGLGAPLRRLAESAEPCVVHRTDGVRHDGSLHRVGSDFVELTSGEVGRVLLVAVDRIAAIQSRP